MHLNDKPIQREVQQTADGSFTLFVPSMDEHYHSVNGAIQESRHVFIEAALHHHSSDSINVFEIGFGTGLNAFLTLIDAIKNSKDITYYSVEKYPLTLEESCVLGYEKNVDPEYADYYMRLHEAPWNSEHKIADGFNLFKIKGDNNDLVLPNNIDVVYFDAFAPDKQPEMWSEEIFSKLYAAMNPGGILTTYCAKGSVRRMMQKAGYSVERIPGPPGKREMLRASKL